MKAGPNSEVTLQEKKLDELLATSMYLVASYRAHEPYPFAYAIMFGDEIPKANLPDLWRFYLLPMVK